jgi:predicted permease
VRVNERMRDGSNDRSSVSAGTFADVAARQRAFVQLAAFNNEVMDGVFVGGDQPSVVKIQWTEPALLRTLGVTPALGRPLRDDDAADTVRSVLITHRAWQRLYAGDPAVVGRRRASTASRAPSSACCRAASSARRARPTSTSRWDLEGTLKDPVASRGAHWLGVVGRLRPGVEVETARRELSALGDELSRAHPRDNGNITVGVMPLRTAMVGDTRTPLLVLMASAGLVLVITCANLAGALLSRTLSRQREFAVRVAIGAGGGRLVRQLLTESLVLALAGGAAGVLLAVGALRLLAGLAAQALPPYADLSLDPGALLFTSALAVATGLAFGLAPALSARRANTQGTLRDESRGTTESGRSRRLRGLLVAGQIALCVSLLTGAGLLVRSLAAMLHTPAGFDAERVLTVSVQLPGSSYGDAGAQARFYAQLTARLGALPGVTGVADATALPMAVRSANGFDVVGAPPPADGAPPFVPYAAVSDDYFRMLRIPLREGRTFGPQDGMNGARAMVVSEATARKFWPRGGAVGAQLRMGPDRNAPPITVIGVVGDVRNDPAHPRAEPMSYGTTRQDVRPSRFLLVRTTGDPVALVAPFRRELAALDRGVPLRDATPLTAFLSDRLTARRLPVVLMSAFGVLALVLASVGVYAMFAAMTTAREREFGVRVALGSSRGRIAGLVLRQGGAWMALGLAGGAAGIAVVARYLRDLLYGVEPFDPVTIAVTVAALVACGLLALLVPVRRATRVDPISALR